MDLAANIGTHALLERDAAIEDLSAAAREVCGGRGAVVLVEAGAGLGKTAFLDHCVSQLEQAGMRVLAARGSELERDFPYAIVRQLMAGVRRPAQLRAAVLAGPAAAARILVADARAPDGDDDAEPFQIMNALYWAVVNLCDLGPVAMLIDDAHEADDSSMRFLSFLARRLADLPLLLVVATRPPRGGSGSLAQQLREATDPVAVTLPPLSQPAVSVVLRDAMGAMPDSEFTQACTRATGGNPFYVQELVRSVVEAGLPPTSGAVDQIDGVGPESVAHRLLSRLSMLPPAALPLARACAVLGEGARLPICARLADVSLDDAAAAADALIREGVLAPGPYLAFLHPILQAAVLADLGDHSRRRWHARAARILDEDGYPAELVALHLIRTDPSGDPHVRDTLVRAGRAAARDGSPAVAAQYLARAVEESRAAADGELLYELGLAQASVGDQGGLQHMAAGVAATLDPNERAMRAIRLANFQMRSGDLVQSVDTLAAVRAGVRDEELLRTIDAYRYWAGRLHPQTRDEAMALAERLRTQVFGADTAAQRTLLAFLACEAAQTETAQAAGALFDRALAPPGLLDFVAFDAVATQASMLSLSSLERYADFEHLADRVLAEAGQRGAVLAFLVVSTFRAMVMWHRGDLAAAEYEARDALRAAREQGWQHGAVGLLAIHAIALLDQGDVAGAVGVFADSSTVHIPPGFPTALMLFARARIAAARGHPAEAVEDLRTCGRTLEQMRIMSPGVLPWRSQLVGALTRTGEVDEAVTRADEEIELARRLAGPIALGRALHARASLLRSGARVEMLEQAHTSLVDTAGHLALAEVAVDLGAALRQDKRAAEARTYLADGLELAARCRAAPLVARAREELEILGVTPRRSHAYGPDALTPSEVRVTRLAADGRSNAEIAQQLFVTRKTVEKHLASAYRKLGIASRSGLDDALRAAESSPG